MNNWKYKLGFYLLSMVFFLVIVMILGTSIPICFGGVFLGWRVFLRRGVLIPTVCIILLCVTFFFCCRLCKLGKGTKLGPVTNTTYTNVSSDVMSFVASYFFPLVSFSIGTTWRHVVVLGILFVLIGLIYIKSDIYYCNPTLLLLGFRTYKVTGMVNQTQNINFDKTIIVWGSMKNGDEFKYIDIDVNTCFAFKI